MCFPMGNTGSEEDNSAILGAETGFWQGVYIGEVR